MCKHSEVRNCDKFREFKEAHSGFSKSWERREVRLKADGRL